MGYFSNGTEGEMYREAWCDRCVHDESEDCPIWLAHLISNGKDEGEQNLLDLFIPQAKDKCSNLKCVMFIESKRAS